MNVEYLIAWEDRTTACPACKTKDIEPITW